MTPELDRLMEPRGEPESVRSDNGPEFTSRRMAGWGEERKISLIHIQPGRPTAERTRQLVPHTE
jgi:putative transposase